MNETLEPSRANPLGRSWHELDFQARLDVLKEKVNRLADRLDLPARGQAAPVGVEARAYAGTRLTDAPEVQSARESRSPEEAEKQTRDWLGRAFSDFMLMPTNMNFSILKSATDAYQADWMQGRKRVTIAD